jgi:hypothetical protein
MARMATRRIFGGGDEAARRPDVTVLRDTRS